MTESSILRRGTKPESRTKAVPAGAPTRVEQLAVFLSCAAASLAAQLWSWQHHAMLNYGDAVAHLHIARRILDSHRPGLTQLGSVWLPLPHLLMFPFVQVYAWWANGIAGAIPSALAYLAACLGIYRLARRWLPAAPSALALAFFALNPNLLYLQTTAMDETLFLCEVIWIVLWLVEWRTALDEEAAQQAAEKFDASSVSCQGTTSVVPAAQQNKDGALAPAGSFDLNSPVVRRFSAVSKANRLLWCLTAALVAAVFTRYDGWVFAFLAWIGMAVTLARRGGLRSRSFWLASALLAAAPAAWFVYNAAFFGDWLYFARGPYSAQAIELRTKAPGWPPHPGWHNPWVSLLFFLKVSEMDAAVAAWGNLVLALSVLGTAFGWLLARRRAFAWILLLWLPVPFYACAVAYGSVPIFIPPWWPHSYYNTRYGMELLPALALGLAFFARFFLGLVREFKPGRIGRRWRMAATAFLFALVGFNFAKMIGERPLVYVESTKNLQARRPYDLDIPPVLRSLLASRPGGIILMNASRYPELVYLTGIPLRQTLNESDRRYFKAALAAPAAHAAIVLTFAGDQVDRAVKAHPQGLTEVYRFTAKGQPAATIYVSGQPAGAAPRALNKPA